MSKMRKLWKNNQVAIVTAVLVLLVIVFPAGSFLKAQMPMGGTSMDRSMQPSTMMQPSMGGSQPMGGTTMDRGMTGGMTQPSMGGSSMGGMQPSMGGSNYGSTGSMGGSSMDRGMTGGTNYGSTGSMGGTPPSMGDRSMGGMQPMGGTTMDRGMTQPSMGGSNYGPTGSMGGSSMGGMQPSMGSSMGGMGNQMGGSMGRGMQPSTGTEMKSPMGSQMNKGTTQPSMGGSSMGGMQPMGGSTMDRGMTQPSMGGTNYGSTGSMGGDMKNSMSGSQMGKDMKNQMGPSTGGTRGTNSMDQGQYGVGNPPTFNTGDKSMYEVGPPPLWMPGDFEDFEEGEDFEDFESEDYGMQSFDKGMKGSASDKLQGQKSPMYGKEMMNNKGMTNMPQGFKEFDFGKYEEGEAMCDPGDPYCQEGEQVEQFESKMDMYMNDYSDMEGMKVDPRQVQGDIKDITQQAKNIGRMLKDSQRQFKKIDLTIESPVITNLNSVMTEMDSIRAEAEAFGTRDASSVTQAEIEEMRDKLDYLREELEPQMRDMEPQLRMFEELKNFNREVERLNKEADRELSKFTKNNATEKCLAPLNEAKTQITAIQADPLADLDPEFMDPRDLYDQLDTIRFEYFDKARECQDSQMKEQWKGKKGNVEDVLGASFDEDIASTIEEKLFSRMSNTDELINSIMEQVMGRVMEQMAGIIEKVSADVADKMARMTESIASAPQAIQEKASATQEEVYAVVKDVAVAAENLDSSVQREVKKVTDAIAEELWTEKTAKEFIPKVTALETLIENGATREEVITEAREVKKAIDEAKTGEAAKQFSDGLRPWKDVDPTSDWHAGYDFKVKDLGIMKGDGATGYTELKPANETNRAEAVVMAARAAGVEDLGKGKNPTSRVGQGMPEWAKPAAAALEARGVNLDSILKGGADGSITRGEASVLVAETLDLEATSDSVANNFKDNSKFSPSLKKAAAALYENGIMTGYGSGSPMAGQLGVDQPFLRAELAKVIVEAQAVAEEVK